MSEFSVKSTREEIRRLTRLSGPVVLAQLGGMTLGVVDMMMLGRVSPSAMAAATLGNIILMGITIPMMGILMGADPLMSQAHGAGDRDRIARVLQRSLVLVPLITIPIALVCFAAPWILAQLDQPAHLIPMARRYILINLPGLPLFLAFGAVRQYLQARGIVHPGMWIMLAVNLVNAFANWVLIFGNLGAPELGIEGSAIATCVTRSSMVLAMVVWVRARRLHVGYWVPWSRSSFQLRSLWEVAAIGLPITASLAVEMWAFQASSILAGHLGEDALAAHSLVFHIIALIFMVPLGVSIGSAVRVGNLIGAGDPRGAQRTAYVALAMSGVFMLAVSVAFVFGNELVPRAFTDEPELLALAAGLLPIAALFQVFDGSQCVCSGILRGMGRTRIPALAHAIGFYVLGLPLAWWLLHHPAGTPGQLTDIWWGLCTGLFVVSVLLLAWVRWRGPATLEVGEA
ncbi:MAG: MATE family efflux transporter [Planctomycetota bacterium]|nr:MATE family efflux transporter [Planctomycetota bacterium]